MASGDKFYLADKPTLDEVKGKIGSTNDAQSSSMTSGSIFAKLNYLIVQVSNYLAGIYVRIGSPTDSASNNTTATAHQKLNWFLNLIGKTDDAQSSSTTTGSIFAKLNYLVYQVSIYLSTTYSWASKIGNTNDTGGTTTAGSVTAKENAILTEVNKIGNTNDTGATATTGSLFAKVNSIFNKSCVKSVQRGTVTMDSSIKQVTISPVDMNKSFVLVSCTNTSTVSYLTIEVGIRAYLSSSTTIRFDTTAWGDRYTTGVTWQVIELN